MAKKLFKRLLVVALFVGLFQLNHEKLPVIQREEKLSRAEQIYQITASKQAYVLEVPLYNQMDEPALYNGCEVTSLAMLLTYSGHTVTKNELAARIPKVPLTNRDGTKGDPREGFVGSIEGKSRGLGVYLPPIKKLTEKYVAAAQIGTLDSLDDEAVENLIMTGHPIWIITTTDYAPPKTSENWQTKNGEVRVTYSMHSVVITGFDDENFYVNDPYGYKNRPVDRALLKSSVSAMGNQIMYLNR
ncbi:C39 family peptidase [Listeria costaricensis]|uniref:C39 family peptidase n=1 Tax=Listeria costaricensis TaxID=2026604 RepID=UPI000C06CBCF|nr:C39 family peptidase [Listeria costaricensis]